MKKRICSISLLLALLLTSCGGGGDVQETEETAASTITETQETEAPSPGFPKEDNAGQTIKILMGDHSTYEFMIEELTGETMDDAVYNRNIATEEYLGIQMEFENRASWGGSDTTAWLNQIENSVLAGGDDYQLINGINVYTVQLIPKNMFLNLYNIESIDLENPWWVPGYPIANGKLFYAFNDAAFSLHKDLYCMFFNSTLVGDMSLENPYDYVLDGTWTMEKFIELAQAGAVDLNGDGTIDAASDQLSYVFKHAANRAFMCSTDCTLIEEDGNGGYVLSALSERLINAYEMMRTFIADNDAISCSYEADYGVVAKPFIEGRTLFMTNCLCTAEYMREMEDEFGILPMPKYDEAQSGYRSQVATSTSAFYIPTTVADAELVGKTCEVLGFYSNTDIVPVYFDVAMKGKYSRDEATREMVDIVRNSIVTSFEAAYSTLFTTWPNDVFNWALEDADIVSKYESAKSSLEKKLAELMELELK